MGQNSSKPEAPARTGAHGQTTTGPGDRSQQAGSDPLVRSGPPATPIPSSAAKFHSPSRGEPANPAAGERRSTDLTRAGLDPLSPSNTGTAVDLDDEITPLSFSESFSSATLPFGKKRVSRQASFAAQDTEFCHPETKKPIFRRRSVPDRPSLRIVDPTLISALKGDSTGLQGKHAFDGVYLSPAASIHEPYEMLFYNRKRISELEKEADDTGKHAQFLLQFMKNERSATWKKAVELDKKQCYSIAFEDCWLLYPPGETVFRRDAGGWRAYKVSRVEVSSFPSPEPIRIYGYYLGFDKSGKSLVPHREILEVTPYPSEKAIESLEVVPEWHIKRSTTGFCTKLIARGKLYWEYRDKPFHKEYTGDAWPTTMESNTSRVIVDHVTASSHEREVEDDANMSQPLECLACLGEALHLGPYPSNLSHHDSDVCLKQLGLGKVTKGIVEKSPLGIRDVTGANNNEEEEQLLLYCPSMVWSFSLQHHTWAQVPMRHLEQVHPDDEDWKQLWMKDDTEKDHLDAAVSSFLEREAPILVGKRRGFNVHLYGGPGTGKTFTAECLARKYALPLYQVTCSYIGMEPRTLDRELRRIFLRAANWGALLLLEDADLFLQDRHIHPFQRSALVSVFLSRLDASDALVFMTSSVDEKHDTSLEARVHLPLHFDNLDYLQQSHIWMSLINSVNFAEADRKKLMHFVEVALKNRPETDYVRMMNGRQIQSCFRAALTLAVSQKEAGKDAMSLKVHQLEKVLDLGSKFRAYVANGEPSSVGSMVHNMMGMGP